MNKVDLQGLIAKHAASAPGDQAQTIDDLFKVLEPLLEDTALQGRYSTAAIKHLEERNKEVSSVRLARNLFLWLGAFLILLVLGVFYWALITPAGHLALAALGNAQIAFVSATFISGFGLLAIILRGVFGASDKDDSGGLLVESIKTLVEIGRSVVK